MKKLILVCLCLFTSCLNVDAAQQLSRFVEYSTPYHTNKVKGTVTGGHQYLIDRKYNIVCYRDYRALSCVQVQGMKVE